MALIAEATQTGARKNVIIFFHFAYELPARQQAFTAARSAVQQCLPSGAINLSAVASCVATRFNANSRGPLRGLGLVPDLRRYLGRPDLAVGVAFDSGGVFVFPFRQAHRDLATGRVVLGPPLKAVFLLPQVLLSRH